MIDFHVKFAHSCKINARFQRFLAPLQALALVNAVVGLLAPTIEYASGFRFREDVHWAHVLRVPVIYVYCGVSTALLVFLSPVLASRELHRTLAVSMGFVFDDTGAGPQANGPPRRTPPQQAPSA